MRLAPENRNRPKLGPANHLMKVCPNCKVDRGVNAFAKMAKFCNDCRKSPKLRRHVPTDPTVTEREAARAAVEVARFDDFARSVREQAGLPRR